MYGLGEKALWPSSTELETTYRLTYIPLLPPFSVITLSLAPDGEGRVTMKTVAAIAFAALVGAGIAAPALAATTTPPANQNPTTTMSVRDQVRDELTKSGFTDVQVMPESFLVRAKDSKGNPVMMIINPDSFTELTKISPKTETGGNAGGAIINAPAK